MGIDVLKTHFNVRHGIKSISNWKLFKNPYITRLLRRVVRATQHDAQTTERWCAHERAHALYQFSEQKSQPNEKAYRSQSITWFIGWDCEWLVWKYSMHAWHEWVSVRVCGSYAWFRCYVCVWVTNASCYLILSYSERRKIKIKITNNIYFICEYDEACWSRHTYGSCTEYSNIFVVCVFMDGFSIKYTYFQMSIVIIFP